MSATRTPLIRGAGYDLPVNGAFDTHTHLQFEQFDEDRGSLIEACWASGLEGMLVVGTDVEASLAAVKLASSDPRFYATAGIHPHDASAYDETAEGALRSLAEGGDIVALGEMGLDYYRMHSTREAQEHAFDRQLALATDYRLPVVVHTRQAIEEAFLILQEWAKHLPGDQPRGVMHCFSGSLEQARRFAEMGFLISMPATITYPRNDEQRKVAANLPLTALVVETDSPYLPPQGQRGKRNDPRNLRAAIVEVARVRGQPEDEIVKATTENARRMLRV